MIKRIIYYLNGGRYEKVDCLCVILNYYVSSPFNLKTINYEKC